MGYSDEQKEELGKCEALIDANVDASKKKKFEGAGADDLMKLKDIEHRCMSHFHTSNTKEKIQALSWGPCQDDLRLGVCDQMGACIVFNTQTKLRMYGANTSFGQSMALSYDQANPVMLVGGMKNATEMFKKESGSSKMTKTKTWIKHDGYISSLHFIDNQKYISASGDSEIRVFDISANADGPSLMVLRGHQSGKDCGSIKFPRDDPSKNVFITCSSDKTVKMWDLRLGHATHTFKTDSELNACTIFPDGKLIGCGGEKDKTYVFDVRTIKQVGKYARNNMKTASCEFSKSGRELFVGHDDGAIVVWDIFGSGDNKQYAKKIEAHVTKYDDGKVDITKSRVQALEVGPSGHMASGGFDAQVKIWGAPQPA